MKETTAVVIIAVSMFLFLALSAITINKAAEACFAVADTPAKLAICKGTTYKEQQ